MKTFKQIREALEGYVSAAQRKAVWASRADGGKGHPDNKKAKKEDAATDKAVKDFLSKGGKIKKLAPGKAAGYHGKDDPGKGMAGMMDKGDTKAIGTRKKVKSMEGVDEELQVYRVGHRSVGGNVHAKSHDDAMAKLRAKGVKGKITLTHRGPANKVIPSHSKTGKPMAATNEAKQTHMFDNEKDARAKAKEIGGKYVKGTGKSAGKHAAIKEKQVNELSPATKKSYINKAAADIDNRSYAQGVDDVKGQGNDYDGANNKRIGNRLKGIRRATK